MRTSVIQHIDKTLAVKIALTTLHIDKILPRVTDHLIDKCFTDHTAKGRGPLGHRGEHRLHVSHSPGRRVGAGGYIFMISAKSGQQDGAWQFVRQFLTPEYQNGTEIYDMPVLKSAFLAKAQEATERPYWTDENGNKEYYDDTWYANGEEIILEPFTQEEVDAMCEFIYTVNRTAYDNEFVRNIIAEEAEAYFAGQKTVQDVVDIIQSRVQVYVNENQ